MKNKFEHILLSVLLALAVVLGLSFWLNTIFGFNMFCTAHWDEFAKLQASKTPISNNFYISFIMAIFILLICIYAIFRPANKNTKKETVIITETKPLVEQKPVEIKEQKNAEPVISDNRPPRLNLPKNIIQINEQNHTNNKPSNNPAQNPYNQTLSEIFSENGYIVKQNPVISGFTPNLFAIGNNEVVWIGGVDCDMEKIMSAVQKLHSVFTETLEDIPIKIHSFILDTMNKYDTNNSVSVFKTTDELKEFISKHPADKISEEDREDFDSYSEYIDTIIRYIKNV